MGIGRSIFSQYKEKMASVVFALSALTFCDSS